MNWTHDELIDRAVRWLKNSFNCRIVLKEPNALTKSCEIPDAIGWVGNKSILVECKISKQDFYADRKKTSRNYNCPQQLKDAGIYYPALGNWRFYLTPPHLLTNVEIPEGWGLYEVRGKTVKHIKGESYKNTKILCESDRDSEVALLLNALKKEFDKRELK